MTVHTEPQVEEPAHLLCPITQALYHDPVFVVESGSTYDRQALLEFWQRAEQARDPLTNVILPNREVRTNWDIRRQVQAFLDAHPSYVPGGWESRELGPAEPIRRVPEAPAEPHGQAQAEGGDPEDPHALPRNVRAHCANLAMGFGGRLPENMITHLAVTLNVAADRLRQEFGGPPPERNDAARLPAEVVSHCTALAQAHGGRLPEHLIEHFASAFGLNAAQLREEFGQTQH
eukprot:TRINITY_DN123253_c0_g1_i1.p1 TRINITY_DN123253_c0_g1~~TRINITY_DN123253_c0_g1_i1.p1  ORF type:complete len:232 (+),score=28.37 TRINITY_DN123253_c0_g1_i1:68-763(+)